MLGRTSNYEQDLNRTSMNPNIRKRLMEAEQLNDRNSIRIENLTNLVRKINQDVEHLKDKIETFQAYLDAMMDEEEEWEEANPPMDDECSDDHSTPDEPDVDEDYNPDEESKGFAAACAALHSQPRDKQREAMTCNSPADSPVYDDRTGNFVHDLTDGDDDQVEETNVTPPSPMFISVNHNRDATHEFGHAIKNAMADSNERFHEARLKIANQGCTPSEK